MTAQQAVDGVQALRENAKRLGFTEVIRPATVIDLWQSPDTTRVVLDGDTVPVRAISLIGQIPPNSRVVVKAIQPEGFYIIGYYGAGGYSGRLPDQVLDGAVLGNTGNIVSGVSTETNIPQLALSAYLYTGNVYNLEVQMVCQFTVATTDTWVIRARTTTAVSGTLVGFGRWNPTAVDTKYFKFPYEATATGLTSIFFSIGRTGGAGTVTVVGAPGAFPPAASFSAIREAGPTSTNNGPWRMNVT